MSFQIIELLGFVISLLAYMAVGITLYGYLVSWMWGKPEAIAAAITERSKLRALIEALGMVVFSFILLLAGFVMILGEALLNDIFFPYVSN